MKNLDSQIATKIIISGKCNKKCMSCPIEEECRFHGMIEGAKEFITQKKIESGELVMQRRNMSTFEELKENVMDWAQEKGILSHGTTWAQVGKTQEEVGELILAIGQDDKPGICDGIGDVMVTLIILAEMNDMSPESCLEYAYNEIKGRTGKMINGTFVKEKK